MEKTKRKTAATTIQKNLRRFKFHDNVVRIFIIKKFTDRVYYFNQLLDLIFFSLLNSSEMLNWRFLSSDKVKKSFVNFERKQKSAQRLIVIVSQGRKNSVFLKQAQIGLNKSYIIICLLFNSYKRSFLYWIEVSQISWWYLKSIEAIIGFVYYGHYENFEFE